MTNKERAEQIAQSFVQKFCGSGHEDMFNFAYSEILKALDEAEKRTWERAASLFDGESNLQENIARVIRAEAQKGE